MNLKEFYEIANRELKPLYGENLIDFRLEQVKRLKDDSAWEVVVSFLMENKNEVQMSGPLANLTNISKYKREYKAFIIDDNKKVTDYLIFSES